MRIKHLAAVTVGLSLVLAACGGDDDSADTTTPTTAELSAEMTEGDTVEGTTDEELSAELTEGERIEGTTDEELSAELTQGETVEGTTDESESTVAPTSTTDGTDEPGDEVPQAIISLSPTATEMLYAIGAGDQVLAVDDFSNFPPEAAAKMQGLSGFTPNVEAIAGLEPDLVVTDGTNTDLLEQLDTLGIPHWEGPAAASFDDVYVQIEQLGAATGHVGEAAELVASMQTDVSDIVEGLTIPDEPLTYYHELDDSYFSVTSDTFIGAVYSEVGLVNIADDAGIDSPYPQLNAEFIISADPDLIFLACTEFCGVTAESVAARDGWSSVSAVQNGGVIEVDGDTSSRWGPRIVDYLRQVAEAVAAVQVSEPAS